MQRCDWLRLALFSETFPPQVNGVARTLERLANAVEERGGAVKVFAPHDPDVTIPSAREVRYPSRQFWAYEQLRLAWPSQKVLRRELQSFRPTLVHAATEFGVGIAGRRAARALNIPFVSSYHTSFAAYAQYYHLGAFSRPGWHFLRWFHNGGLRTYCPTQAIIDEVTSHGFRNTRIWSRGVDTTRFNPRFRSLELRTQMGASDETLVVGYIGRLAAEKGIDVVLDAMRMAMAQRPGKFVFACVGDGPLEDEVRKRIPAHSWMPGKLTGDALSAAYASCDLFIFPSVTDTFGNVLLEAMASGLPVLGADVGPTRELIRDERGWLVAPVSAVAFAAQLVSLVDNRVEVGKRRAFALEFALASTWERVWDALFADYHLLQEGAR